MRIPQYSACIRLAATVLAGCGGGASDAHGAVNCSLSTPAGCGGSLHNNGVLEPGIPLTVITSGKTDAMGLATVSLRYPRDRANQVKVELSVTGTVVGTESLARNTVWLMPLAKDLSAPNVSPPGQISPYGRLR